MSIDINGLGSYLEANVAGFSGLEAVEKFDKGQSNPTYKLTAKSGDYVLRAKPPGELLRSAHQVDREYRVMKALGGSGVPVPKVLHLAEGDNPLGRMFYVMEFLDGRILWDPALPETVGRGAIYDAMNKTLVALHSVDVEKAGLADFGRPGSYFARQTDRWIKQYKTSVLVENADMDRVMPWLVEHMPADDGEVSLVHGDYRLDNMVFSHVGPDVIGVLDWELSTLGHPLADLAYQCMQWRLPYEGGMRGLGGIDRAALGIPGEEDYVSAYCARRGIGEITDWDFYLAFCFFRLASILQGVVRRAHDGNASNPESAKRMAAAVPVLAAMAADLTKG